MTLVEASVKGVHYFVLTSLKFKKNNKIFYSDTYL